MSDLGLVVLLAGGLSHERDVSLRSGRRVAEVLRDVGVEVAVHDLDAALLPAMAGDPPSVVLPLLHGAQGEDGAIRDVLEMLRLPYVGSTPQACRTAFDKPVAKALVSRGGLASPASVVLPHAIFRELGAAVVLDTLVARLGLPLVVKPTRGGSALGCTVVRDASELPSAMVNCFAYGDTALIEEFIAGTEVSVSVIDGDDGPRALPPVEICPDGEAYDYQARYTAGATEFFVPARLDPAATQAVTDVALAAHRILGLRDLSRTDLIVDEAGQSWFLEVNVAPGMTETSLFPQSVAVGGADLGTVLRDLCHRAAARGT